MNTFKTAVVLATLLGVGYGMHVVLNQPADDGSDTSWGETAGGPLASLNLDAFKKQSAAKGGRTDNASPSTQPPSIEMPPANAPLASGLVTADPSGSPAGPAAPASMPPLSVAATPPASATTNPTSPMTTMTPVQIAPVQMTGVQPMATNVNQPITIQTVSASTAATGNFAAAPANLVPGSSDSSSLSTSDLFEESWQSAQSQIQSKQYVEALMALSLTLSAGEMTDEQRSRLIGMLDQLAGTVIYSPQHTLSAPYVVQAGETWDTIALQMAVTPEFLSRVNQLSLNDPLSPGQRLKVVHGPFRAELSAARRELTVFLGRFYAGRFEVAVGREMPAQLTQIDVASKEGPRPYYDRGTGQVIQAGAPDNPYGNHWISLRYSNDPTDQGIGIHSSGAQVEAADTRGCISVSDGDADDLKAILVVGSKVSMVR